MCSKQILECKSSTEADVVAVDDCAGHVLRIRYCLLTQGYEATRKLVILQDNQSSILFGTKLNPVFN